MRRMSGNRKRSASIEPNARSIGKMKPMEDLSKVMEVMKSKLKGNISIFLELSKEYQWMKILRSPSSWS